MEYEKDKNEIVPEEFGFVIHPTCKICNSIYKPEIDKMILEGVAPSRIVDFCMIIDPENNKQRIAGSENAITKNVYNDELSPRQVRYKLQTMTNSNLIKVSRKNQKSPNIYSLLKESKVKTNFLVG